MSTSSVPPPFNLTFPVRDLQEARAFYGGVLDCAEGRSTPSWVDFDFFGNRIVAHLCVDAGVPKSLNSSVDGREVPASHFGAVVPRERWCVMADALVRHGVAFMIEPHVRFEGQPGEHASMFFRDPSGNAIEMKSFEDLGQLFAK
jgi:uncharacterized protein